MNSKSITLFILVTCFSWIFPSGARGAMVCPFCNALGATITEEIESAKVAIFAKCIRVTPAADDRSFPIAFFELTEAFKGKEYWTEASMSVLCIDPVEVGDRCLLLGFQCEPLEFGQPLVLSQAAFDYVRKVSRLSDDAAERLAFFFSHLQSKEKLVYEDAYNEFAKVSYTEAAIIKPYLKLEEVKRVLRDPETSKELRSLFWTFLSIVGSKEDAPFFHEMLASDLYRNDFNPGLDAAIACYISLVGEEGLREIKADFFEKKGIAFGRVFSAILAIRVQVDEMKGVSKELLSEALHPLLEDAEMAQQVIPDLARWEDWRVCSRLIQLFRELDSDHTYVRDHILRYLKVCPTTQAKEAHRELCLEDPQAAKRSQLIFGGGLPSKK